VIKRVAIYLSKVTFAASARLQFGRRAEKAGGADRCRKDSRACEVFGGRRARGRGTGQKGVTRPRLHRRAIQELRIETGFDVGTTSERAYGEHEDAGGDGIYSRSRERGAVALKNLDIL